MDRPPPLNLSGKTPPEDQFTDYEHGLADGRAEAAEEIRNLQAENERLRAALQRIADFKEQEYDGYNTATILSGIAWAALARGDR